jgi:hypothetical protein
MMGKEEKVEREEEVVNSKLEGESNNEVHLDEPINAQILNAFDY